MKKFLFLLVLISVFMLGATSINAQSKVTAKVEAYTTGDLNLDTKATSFQVRDVYLHLNREFNSGFYGGASLNYNPNITTVNQSIYQAFVGYRYSNEEITDIKYSIALGRTENNWNTNVKNSWVYSELARPVSVTYGFINRNETGINGSFSYGKDFNISGSVFNSDFAGDSNYAISKQYNFQLTAGLTKFRNFAISGLYQRQNDTSDVFGGLVTYSYQNISAGLDGIIRSKSANESANKYAYSLWVNYQPQGCPVKIVARYERAGDYFATNNGRQFMNSDYYLGAIVYQPDNILRISAGYKNVSNTSLTNRYNQIIVAGGIIF